MTCLTFITISARLISCRSYSDTLVSWAQSKYRLYHTTISDYILTRGCLERINFDCKFELNYFPLFVPSSPVGSNSSNSTNDSRFEAISYSLLPRSPRSRLLFKNLPSSINTHLSCASTIYPYHFYYCTTRQPADDFGLHTDFHPL